MMNLNIVLALDNLKYSVKNLTTKDKYINSHGRVVPSVTEILHAMIHKDALMYWSNSIGLKGIRYGNYMANASRIGTACHEAIEKYIKTKEKTDSNIPFMGFLLWYENLINTGNTVEILGSEVSLCCLWFGGTCDLVMKINGKVYVVDFKTSNHISSNYFLQLGGYGYLLEDAMSIIVDGGYIVLQLNKEEVGFDEYILLMDNPEHYEFMEKARVGFLSLVYAYYHVVEVDNCFKRAFNGRDIA